MDAVLLAVGFNRVWPLVNILDRDETLGLEGILSGANPMILFWGGIFLEFSLSPSRFCFSPSTMANAISESFKRLLSSRFSSFHCILSLVSVDWDSSVSVEKS